MWQPIDPKKGTHLAYLRDQLTFSSLLRYGIWRLSQSERPVKVQLRSGTRLELHPGPFGDLFGLEIFVNEVYRCPETGALASVRNIVDVGANIGLSCVYWAQKFTSSKFWLLSPDANTWVAYIRPTNQRTRFTLGRLSAGRYIRRVAGCGAMRSFSLVFGPHARAGPQLRSRLGHVERGPRDRQILLPDPVSEQR